MRRHFTLEELSAWLDGEAELTPAQRTHLAECAECGRVAEANRRLREAARAAAPRVPSEDMWRAIAERIGPAPRPRTEAVPDRSAFTVRRIGPWRRFWRSLSAHPGRLALVGAAALVAVFLVKDRPVDRRELFTPVSPSPSPSPAQTPLPPGGRGDAGRAGEGAPVAPAEPSEAKPSPAPKHEQPKTARRAPAPIRKAPEHSMMDAPPAEYLSAVESERPLPPPTPAPTPTAPEASPAAPAAGEQALSPVEGRAPRRSSGQAAREAVAPTSAAWRGRSVAIKAYRIDRPLPGYLVATGGVVVTPLDPAAPWLADVDGVSRTLTGAWRGAAASVTDPGERLSLTSRTDR